MRAELIEGCLIYDHAALSWVHQTILSELHITIGNYIRLKDRACGVYPVPFAVKLFKEGDTIEEPGIGVISDSMKITDRGCTGVRKYWIVNSDKKNIFVYYLEKDGFKAETYIFHDTIDVNIYEDLQIDFAARDIWK